MVLEMKHEAQMDRYVLRRHHPCGGPVELRVLLSRHLHLDRILFASTQILQHPRAYDFVFFFGFTLPRVGVLCKRARRVCSNDIKYHAYTYTSIQKAPLLRLDRQLLNIVWVLTSPAADTTASESILHTSTCAYTWWAMSATLGLQSCPPEYRR